MILQPNRLPCKVPNGERYGQAPCRLRAVGTVLRSPHCRPTRRVHQGSHQPCRQRRSSHSSHRELLQSGSSWECWCALFRIGWRCTCGSKNEIITRSSRINRGWHTWGMGLLYARRGVGGKWQVGRKPEVSHVARRSKVASGQARGAGLVGDRERAGDLPALQYRLPVHGRNCG